MTHAGWWMHDLFQQGGIVPLVTHIFWVIFSITLHELAHGWAAIWQGDQTPRRLGHMTGNPMVHMGAMSLIMFAVTGFTWGMMPVDPSRFRWKRKGRIVVSGAGPAMNLLLAFVSLTACAIWDVYGTQTQPLRDNVWQFLFTGGWLNIALAAFNMLPIPPLDGADVLSGFSLRFYRFFQNPQTQQIALFALIIVFATGLGGVFSVVAAFVSAAYVAGVGAVLP